MALCAIRVSPVEMVVSKYEAKYEVKYEAKYEANYEAKQGERKMKRTADPAKHGTTYW